MATHILATAPEPLALSETGVTTMRINRFPRITLAALLFIGFAAAAQANPPDVMAVPGGFVARIGFGQPYWRVPATGGSATAFSIAKPKPYYNIDDFTYAQGAFLATVGTAFNGVTNIVSSKDGENWSAYAVAFHGGDEHGIGQVSGLFGLPNGIVSVLTSTGSPPNTCISTDLGRTWQCGAAMPQTTITSTFVCNRTLVSYGSSQRVAPSGPSTVRSVAFSPDGRNWKVAQLPSELSGTPVCANDQVWIVAPSADQHLHAWLVTPDGAAPRGAVPLMTAQWLAGDGHRLIVYSGSEAAETLDGGKTFRKFALDGPGVQASSWVGFTAAPVFSDGTFLSTDGSELLSSRDGLTWRPVQ